MPFINKNRSSYLKPSNTPPLNSDAQKAKTAIIQKTISTFQPTFSSSLTQMGGFSFYPNELNKLCENIHTTLKQDPALQYGIQLEDILEILVHNFFEKNDNGLFALKSYILENTSELNNINPTAINILGKIISKKLKSQGDSDYAKIYQITQGITNRKILESSSAQILTEDQTLAIIKKSSSIIDPSELTIQEVIYSQVAKNMGGIFSKVVFDTTWIHSDRSIDTIINIDPTNQAEINLHDPSTLIHQITLWSPEGIPLAPENIVNEIKKSNFNIINLTNIYRSQNNSSSKKLSPSIFKFKDIFQGLQWNQNGSPMGPPQILNQLETLFNGTFIKIGADILLIEKKLPIDESYYYKNEKIVEFLICIACLDYICGYSPSDPHHTLGIYISSPSEITQVKSIDHAPRHPKNSSSDLLLPPLTTESINFLMTNIDENILFRELELFIDEDTLNEMKDRLKKLKDHMQNLKENFQILDSTMHESYINEIKQLFQIYFPHSPHNFYTQ